MPEHMLDRVDVVKRNDELFNILDNECEICWNAQLEHKEQLPRNIDALQNYIANLVEMAYLAGTKRFNCTGKHASHQYMSEEQLAQHYVKDKGLRL